jgi:signal transduction histidine kinase
MAVRFAESFLGTNTDLTHIHRRVVRVGAAAAWLATSILLVAGLFVGDHRIFLEAVAPALAAGLMTAQIGFKRENGGVALFGSAVILMMTYTLIGNPDTLLPVSVALVVVPAIAMLLIESRQLLALSVVSLALFLAPLGWSLGFSRATVLGVVMSLSFAMTAVIFFAIRNTATGLNSRFQTLFESSPAAMLEEDWSEALAYLRSEYSGRPDRIEPFLLAYPSVVRRAVSKARIIRANQAAVDLLEAGSAGELEGYREGDRVTDRNLDAYAGALAVLYQGGTEFGSDMSTLTRAGRPVWLQVKGADTSTGEPASAVLIGLADVTHNKARQEAMADLVRAKDDFIARVSHELRTPLTAVVGLTTEMTSGEALGEEDRAELLQLVAGQAREMAHIVEDLLVASRAEMGTITVEAKRVDLEVELQSTIDGLGLQLVDIPSSIPDVVADPGRVRQILRNLFTNAQRYGGPQVRVVVGGRMGRVWLEVRDDGPGVPEDLISRLFEPYATAHGGIRGSVGLGLSVSRQLAGLMGGSLSYRRENGESVFRVEFPDASPRARPTFASQIADA